MWATQPAKAREDEDTDEDEDEDKDDGDGKQIDNWLHENGIVKDTGFVYCRH